MSADDTLRVDSLLLGFSLVEATASGADPLHFPLGADSRSGAGRNFDSVAAFSVCTTVLHVFMVMLFEISRRCLSLKPLQQFGSHMCAQTRGVALFHTVI